ncbi:cysteine-rich CWC family protein [uncultured Paraglaciecola sp.]|uniref:cysteine-rich CWC family protein n=1 Tax=uncultured Paraglaciecola sp. TaxID=1765024 RepID=UPI003457B1CD
MHLYIYIINFIESVLSLEKSTTPNRCPLCGENNFCGNLSPSEKGAACWCMDSAITFPDSLLCQVLNADKDKKCICKACAQSHNLDSDNSSQ